MAGPVLKSIEHCPPGIVFLDPPYEMEREYAATLGRLGEAPPELVVAQHSIRLALRESYGGLRRTRTVRQGDNALSFFQPPAV